jgi:NAD(P)H-flavin reductase
MKTITSTVQVFLLVLASAKAFVPPRFVVPQIENVGTTVVRLVPLNPQLRQPYRPLFMGWGPEPIWSAAEIKTNVAANQSGKSVSLKITVPPETAEDYKIPGQYVQIRLNEDTKALFLAIASAPDKENAEFEFLVKKTDDNGWITDAPAGTKVEMSQVLGGGFPIQENLEGFKYDFPTQNILLFSAGSGIAPIKAAMESGQLNVAGSGSGGRTARLYYGVQTAEDLCFVQKFSEWESMGFQVVPVLSQPSPEWNGRTGYVQNCLEEDGVPIPRNSGALLCGQKGMAESIKVLLSKAGVFEGRILTNF